MLWKGAERKEDIVVVEDSGIALGIPQGGAKQPMRPERVNQGSQKPSRSLCQER